MRNGEIWLDSRGDPIQAHGGMILKHGDTYFWYGENKAGATLETQSVGYRVDFIGISCYSSKDLIHWNYEGLALKADFANDKSDLHLSKVCERPKVIYNAKNHQFVMWIHIDNADYTLAKAGVAVSDTPAGPFTYIGSTNPNRSDSRDMTLFQDVDQKVYLVHSSEWNKTIYISQLNDDYTGFTDVYTKAFIGQEREAPVVLHYQNRYYMVSSGCTGWEPNSALYGVSSQLFGEWKLIDNPCMGINYRKTFYAQCTYAFQVNDKPYIMFDHWKPNDLKMSGYSILPMRISGDYMEIPWRDEFTMSDAERFE